MTLSEKIINEIGDANKHVISITGAGGKTSLLKLLGSKYRALNNSTLITTSTKIQSPKLYDYDQDYYFLDTLSAFSHEAKRGELVFFASSHLMDPKKCVAPTLEELSAITNKYDVNIIEADGAKGLPLKYHTERDPVILDETTATLCVMGASALNDKLDNVCFGASGREIVDVQVLQGLIDEEEGVLKRAKGKTIVLINQVDLLSKNDIEALKALKLPESVVLLLGSINKDLLYV